MLVLTRKEGETIQIGDDVVIHVARLHGNRVRIGIDAPRDKPIHRGELVMAASPYSNRERCTKSFTPLLPNVALRSMEN